MKTVAPRLRRSLRDRVGPALPRGPLRLTPWRPTRPQPLPARLQRPLREGRVWRLPPHPDGLFLLAASRGGPSLWLLPGGRAQPRAPRGPRLPPALRRALGPIHPLPEAAAAQRRLLGLLSSAAGGAALWQAGLRRHPVPSFACLRPRPQQHGLTILRDGGASDFLEGAALPPGLGRALVPCLDGLGGRRAEEEAATPSRHARLAALAALAARLGLATDDPFLLRIGAG
jgi:hypothetical protein